MNLTVSEFKAERFRSLKRIACPVSQLDVFVGANGVGKTNLYRALELIRSAAANTLAHDLASDGGLVSAFWAGELKRNDSKQILFSVGLTDPERRRAGAYRYDVAIGHPAPTSAAFATEAQIKTEAVTLVSGSSDRGFEACLSSSPTVAADLRRGIDASTAAIQSALETPGLSVALVDLRPLLAHDDVLDRLRRGGYEVHTPGVELKP